MQRYIPKEKIGQGTYGTVWKGIDLEQNETVAMKVLDISDREEGVPGTVIREISLLKELRHANIVRLLDVIHAEGKLTLILEFVEWDLRKYLDVQLQTFNAIISTTMTNTTTTTTTTTSSSFNSSSSHPIDTMTSTSSSTQTESITSQSPAIVTTISSASLSSSQSASLSSNSIASLSPSLPTSPIPNSPVSHTTPLLPLATIKSLLYQLLRALSHCHDRRILHRDLKPSNLLISQSGQLKLADFGLARCSGIPVRSYSSDVVTLWYRPPDVLLGSRNYTTSIDMWSVGCIFAEMFNGVALFRGRNASEQLFRILYGLGTPRDEITLSKYRNLSGWRDDKVPDYPKREWVELAPLLVSFGGELALDLLEMMLHYDPDQRISATDAMKHPFF